MTDVPVADPIPVASAPFDSEPSGGDLLAAIGSAILATLGPEPAEGARDQHLAIVARTAQAEETVRVLLRQAVGAARAQGHSWAAIGAELGLSRQAVQQRFGDRPAGEPVPAEERWLGPVTAFDELTELELAGRMGWHTVEAGMLRHRMVRTDTQWEHKRILWSGSLRRFERDGWQVGCRAFPWVYLIRDLGTPPAAPAVEGAGQEGAGPAAAGARPSVARPGVSRR